MLCFGGVKNFNSHNCVNINYNHLHYNKLEKQGDYNENLVKKSLNFLKNFVANKKEI